MLQRQVELAPLQVTTAAEATPPFSSHRPTNATPPPGGVTGAATATGPNFDELGLGDDPLGTGGISGGNRWPRQETLALIEIRSEMDAAFRDATLKGPLWDEVSRKLGEQGYKRSSKKCKEKFENVHKYYKRSKEGRAGRQDGKSYRFFDQLEALHNITMSQNPSPRAPLPAQISAPTPINTAAPPQLPQPPSSGPELSFSTNTSSSSDYDDSDRGGDGTESGRKKRKRRMMEFFEGMMRQVMERQEAMHQRFLEAIEKREQDRMIREEAWQRQEMSRIARERELAAQERAAAASRDAAIVSFLQTVTGQAIHLPVPPPPPPPPPPPQSQPHTVNEKKQRQQQQNEHPITPPPPPSSSELVLREKSSEPHDPMSSRWPKSEVHALIQLRSRLDSRYQETGPKGPLWEDISAGMQRLGYNRSAKRCKEKWENINKYFKKVKESNKKRPDDAKTCPYFHQLDALYRSKLSSNGGGGGGSLISALDQAHSNLNLNPSPITMIAPSENQGEKETKIGTGGNGENIAAGGDNSGMILKKPEDIMKELMGQSNNDYSEHDSDNMDEYDEDDVEDDDDDGNGQYRIQFQKQNADSNGGSGATPNSGSGKVSGSFLGMVR